MNLTTYCPGIYTSVKQIQQKDGLRAVCIAAKAQSGNIGEVITILNSAAALGVFSAATNDAPLTDMVTAALENGAKKVYAVRCDTLDDYTAAFGHFEKLDDISVVVCDSSHTDICSKLSESVTSCSENMKERYAVIGIVDAGDSSFCDTVRGERNIFVSQSSALGEISSVFITAAAVAGCINHCLLTGDHLNLREFSGITTADSITQPTADTLMLSGITPISLLGQNRIVRCISSVCDKGIRDIQQIISADRLIVRARLALDRLFSKSAHSPVTYSSIETALIVFLERAVDEGLITSYEKPVIKENSEDCTVCDILLSFTSPHGINQIRIFAEAEF